MKILPAKETVICTPPPEDKTGSGVVYTAGEKKPERGAVYAIGKGELPLDIKVGDQVIFRRYADNRMFISGKEYNFIDFKDIVGVVKNAKK